MKFRRSLYVVKDIKAGKLFPNDNIKSIRPDFGITPKFYNEILGKTSPQNIDRGTPLSMDLLEKL